MWHMLIAAVLTLHPVLDEGMPVRFAAAGADEVTWTLDGQIIGTTADRQVLTWYVPPGEHVVQASADDDDWRAFVRPDPPPGDGTRHVDGWSAVAEPSPSVPAPAIGWMLWVLAIFGVLVMMVPRRSEGGK